jgi:hypothetical protein
VALTQGVSNLNFQPKFDNLLIDSPDAIMLQIEISRRNRVTGTAPVEEGIPPYCV